MENLFAVTVPNESLKLRDGRGETTVTVANTTNRAFKGRAEILSDKPEAGPWITVSKNAERQFAPGSVEQFVVQLNVPKGAKEGQYTFRLRLADVADPNERVTLGPVVGFTITPTQPAEKKSPPWWIFLVIGLVLLLIVGGTVYWIVSGPDPEVAEEAPQPTPQPTPAPTPPAPDPTPAPAEVGLASGIWSADDLATYAIRIVGEDVWWLGQSNDAGRSFTNVFHGRRNARQVTGSWADVPIGTIFGSGQMTLEIPETNKLKAVSKTGGFAANQWVRSGEAGALNTRPTGEWPRIPGADTLFGVWNGNDGGTYAIRQVGAEVWWYGQSPDGGRSWANVFHGRIDGRNVTGSWADLPMGGASSFGAMTLQWVDGTTLVGQGTGGFGGTRWTRR